MAIELIAKIAPKNDGFVGMVDADQVIGVSGNGGYLPSSAIQGYNIISSQAQQAYSWFVESSSKLSDFTASGDEYSRAYASSQLLKNFAFLANTPLSSLSDVTTPFDPHAWHSSGLKYNEATGLWEASQLSGGGGSDAFTVKVDATATAGYIGADNSDGVLRTNDEISYTDGGDYVTLGIKSYTKISGNAKSSNAWLVASGQKYSDFLLSGDKYSSFLTSGEKYTSTYTWMTNSGSRYSDFLTSGDAYSKAYASAQIAIYDSTTGGQSPTVWTTPTAVSGIQLTGIGAMSGALQIGIIDYIASTNVIARFVGSTNAITRFADSSNYSTHKGDSTIHYTLESILDDFYPSTLGKLLSGAVLANTSHSANSEIHIDKTLYMTSANIIANYAKSTNLYNRTWIDAFSGNIDTRIDSLGAGISGWYDLDTGTGITAFAGAVAISGTQAETLSVADYIASSSVIANYVKSTNAISRFADSSNYSTHRQDATIHYALESILDDFYPSSLGKQVSGGVLTNANDIQALFGLSSNVLTLDNTDSFTPDADYEPATKKYVDDSIEAAGGYTDEQAQDAVGENVGAGLVYDDDTAAISIEGYSDISSNAYSGYWISANVKLNYYPSSLGKGVSSQVLSLTGFSSNAKHLYPASSAVNKTYVDTLSGSIVTHVDNNFYNQTWVDSFSGNIDTRLDTLEGYDQFNHEQYIISTNAIERFVESGGTKWTDLTDGGETTLHTHAGMTTDVAWSGASEFYVVSSTVKILDTWYDASSSKISDFIASGDEYSTAYSWYTNSSQKISIFVASGDKYSTWYTSGAKLGTAYDHSQDNTQAHTDYLLNNADDTTTGSLTAVAFYGHFSGATISGGSLQMTNTVTDILDEDDMGSDSATALATQQSIKSYVDGQAGGAVGGITWTAPTTSSGLALSGPGKISGALALYIDDYIASTNALSVFAGSSNYSTHKGDSEAHHDEVTLAGTPNYITISDQEITRNKLDLNDDTNFTEGTGIGLATNTVSVLGYATISTNAKSAYDFSSACDIFDSELYVTSANALSTFAHSTNINARFVASSTALDKFYSSSLGKDISSQVLALTGFSSNAKNLYLLSGITYNAISSQSLAVAEYIRHIGGRGNIQMSPTQISFSVGGRESDLNIISGNANNQFFGNVNHNKFYLAWANDSEQYMFKVDPSDRDGEGRIEIGTQMSRDDLVEVAGGGIYSDYISSQTISGGSLKLGTTTVITILDEDDMGSDSATALATQQSIKAYTDSQAGGAVGGVGWTAPSVASGMVLAGDGKISGSATFYIDDYIASTNVIANFTGSSNVNKNYIDNVSSNAITAYNWHTASSQILSDFKLSGDEYTSAYTWFTQSSSRISEFVASGDEYSAIKSSGSIFGQTYTWMESSGQSYSNAYASAQALKNMAFEDATLSTPRSGQTLIYKENNARWENELSPLTYNMGIIRLSSNQNFQVARFNAGNKYTYIWQASCCDSGGKSKGDFVIQVLSGSTSIYKTSSNILQQGYPLARGNGGDTTIRMMYSGSTTKPDNNAGGVVYGQGFVQLSCYGTVA